tara:strand:+ start:503 stop:1225 length:723 start_codon:yes stop_codon:yes gene_type:complete
MGFLDHSTNNIIIDAVLTDTGRRFLSKNDGSFSIVKFALSDDEIDYTMIKQFGRTVGKEKVSKTTLVQEAQTAGKLAQKYRLLSLSNPNLVRLPSLVFMGLTGTDSIGMTRGQDRSDNLETVTVKQTIKDINVVDLDLVDNAFFVTCRNDFLVVTSGGSAITPQDVTANRVATYLIMKDKARTPKGGARLTVDLQTRSITDAQFTTYGNYNNKAMITTFVEFAGVTSGQRITLQVDIRKS